MFMALSIIDVPQVCSLTPIEASSLFPAEHKVYFKGKSYCGKRENGWLKMPEPFVSKKSLKFEVEG